MSENKDGGQVYPSFNIMTYEGKGMESMNSNGGMSRRDWLAGLAMQGFISNTNIIEFRNLMDILEEKKEGPSLSDACYKIADAIIAESNK